jgi:hypothetical protein
MRKAQNAILCQIEQRRRVQTSRKTKPAAKAAGHLYLGLFI